ncbi:hypothetical protein KY315_01405 [Candidatus Woesearchaeota archaeon]|nr:hypothetical protein [Candidatus Woesearchaeota archaeon]
MNTDLFARLREFQNFYYDILLDKEFALSPERKKEIMQDEELWDAQDTLNEELALERYGTSFADASPEELRSIVVRLAQETGEAKVLLDKFETDPEGIRGIFDRYRNGESMIDLDEKLAQIECDVMEAPVYQDLKKAHGTLKRELQELKQAAAAGTTDRESQLRITRLETELNQIRPELETYRAHPASSMDAATFNAIVARGAKAETALKEKEAAETKAAEAKTAKAEAEAKTTEAEAARIAAENQAKELKSQLEQNKTKYNAAYNAAIDAKDEQIKAVQRQVEIAEGNTATVKKEYEQKLTAKDEAHTKNTSELEGRINTLIEDAKKAKKAIESKEEIIKRTDAQLVESGETVDALNKEKEDMTKQFDEQVKIAVAEKEQELKDQYGLSTKEHVDTIQTLEHSANEKGQQITSLKGELADVKSELHEAKEKAVEVDALQSKVKQYEAELPELRTKADALQSTVKQYEAELPELRAKAGQVDELQGTVTQYESDIATLKDAVTKSNEEKAQLTEQQKQDKDEILQKDQKVQTLVDQIKELEEAAETTAKELENLRLKGHEGEDVISKSKYDADLAALNEQLSDLQGKLAASEGATAAVETEYESILAQQKKELEQASVDARAEQDKKYKALLAEKDTQHADAITAQDKKNTKARIELSEKIEKLEDALEAAKAAAVPEGMTLISEEERDSLVAGVRPDGKTLVADDVADRYIEQEDLINMQKSTITNLKDALSDNVDKLEAEKKAHEELIAEFELYKQNPKTTTSKPKSRLWPRNWIGKKDPAEDAKTPAVDAIPGVGTDTEILPVIEAETPTIPVTETDVKADSEIPKTETDIGVTVEAAPEPVVETPAPAEPVVETPSAATGPVYQAEEPIAEPTTPIITPTEPVVETPIPAEPIAEPVESGASIDDAVADASSEPKAEDPVVNSAEQAWYNHIGYAIKQESEVKRPILQAYLNNARIENKRVEAYVLGVLAEDFFHEKDYTEALRFNMSAKQKYADVVENASGNDFDKRQLAKAERNNNLIRKKLGVRANAA